MFTYKIFCGNLKGRWPLVRPGHVRVDSCTLTLFIWLAVQNKEAPR